MALISMEQEDGDEYATASNNAYGYGLRISLTEDQVEALGMKANPPPAGSVVGLRAIAQVTTVTQDADVDGDGDGIDVTLCLQITHLEVEGGGSKTAADSLYGP